MKRELVDQLLSELASFGLECSQDQAELMVGHLELLIEKNKVLNLTRIVDPSDAITLHYVDSLLPLTTPSVKNHGCSSFMDIGTGGGFPGIPFGIMTGSQGVLVDSVGKKIVAVNEFLSELGLNHLKGVHGRIEELARSNKSSQDIVLTRAVAQTNVLIEYATPLLMKNGLLVVEKGNPSDEEVEVAQRAARLCGLTLDGCHSFDLPRQLGHREILVFTKTGSPKIKLPRRVGMAKSQPLGV